MFAIFRIAQKREEAVAREVMKKIADDKKMNKKEKDERFGICFTLDKCTTCRDELVITCTCMNNVYIAACK